MLCLEETLLLKPLSICSVLCAAEYCATEELSLCMRKSRWGIAEGFMASCSHVGSNNKQHKRLISKDMSTLHLS